MEMAHWGVRNLRKILQALRGRRVDSEGFPEVTRIVGDERGHGAISRDDEFVEVDDGVG